MVHKERDTAMESFSLSSTGMLEPIPGTLISSLVIAVNPCKQLILGIWAIYFNRVKVNVLK